MKSYATLRDLSLSIVILVLGLFWIWTSRSPAAAEAGELLRIPQVGYLAPQFELETASGSRFSSDSASGKPLILNFWASWCPPCRAEMPDFEAASQEYAGTDLVIAAVNATNQDALQDVLAFIDTHQLSFPIPLDSAGLVGKAYNVHSLPTTYFIDRAGLIRKIAVGGPIPLALLRVEINNLLEE